MGGYSHTVTLYDAILYEDENGAVCIILVLDYHSKDLRKILDKSDRISINNDHVVKVLYSLLCSLHFLHSAQVIHRDLKPANLLFQKNCSVVTCDFGLARNAPDDTPMRTPTNRDATAAKLEADRPMR